MNELTAALVPVLAQTLLAFVWQGAVVGLLAALALLALREASAQARYAVACAALLACLLWPLATFVGLWADPPAAGAVQWWRLAAAPLRADAGAPSASILGAGDPWSAGAVLAWALGVCVLSLRTAFGVLWIERARRAHAAAHAEWQARLDALAYRFGLVRRVRLLVVDCLPSPVAAGWWKPVVLLPAALIARLPTAHLEALLAHELAHIRRHDYLVNVLQSLVEALLFFHPVVWWLSRRVRQERELVADRLAAGVLGSPLQLAHALVELSDVIADRSVAARLAPAAQGGHLMSRIQQLLRPQAARGGRIALPLIGLAAGCIGLYAHAQLRTAPVTTPTAVAAPAPVVSPAPVAAPAPAVAPAPRPQAHADVVLALEADAAARATAIARAEISEQPYALVRHGEDGMLLSGSSDDIREIEALRGQLGRDFLWFRRDGRAYTVTDPQLLARVTAAWRDSEAVARRMDALAQEMDRHGEVMSELGARMERLSPQQEPSPAMREAQQRMSQLARQQETLAQRQAELARRERQGEDDLRDDMRDIERQMAALQPQMTRESQLIAAEAERIARAAAPMAALSQQMERASQPMEALGRRMQELGEQQQAASERAERETRQLIREALDRGLAAPVQRN
ncbi:MAG TPA: M56 family metallopeptidase [Lysobacter sp.]|nr:M56 family metallopeptidase [Lysobacter sp.]